MTSKYKINRTKCPSCVAVSTFLIPFDLNAISPTQTNAALKSEVTFRPGGKITNNNRFYLFTVSNEVPEHPVVSPRSGAIFERRLIEKYIVENECDPINGEHLKAEELIEIKS